LTDGLSYNYNGQTVPPEALKAIVKRLELAPQAAIEADIDLGCLTGLIFVSERQHNLETLQIALRSNDDGEVKVFTLADIYGTELFGGARLEDSGCIAGGYELDVKRLTITLSMCPPRSPCKNAVAPGMLSIKLILGQAKLSASLHQVRLLNFLSKPFAI
jgi:hypothetical protein